MIKKVFVLQGAGGTGKSQTLKMVYELISSRYQGIIVEQKKITKTDLKVIIVINGVRIGIESQGDPNARLKESLIIFVEAECNIIICVTRTSGMTVKWVEDLKPDYRIVPYQQKVLPYGEPYEVSNRAMAEKIFIDVAKAISG